MSIPPYAWRLGTLAERRQGGIPLMLLADSGMPYSTLQFAGAPPACYNPGTGDPEAQFPGYHRNLDGEGAGQPNFPDGLGFNLVWPNLHGLRNTSTSPPRLVPDPDDPLATQPHPEDGTLWIFTRPNGAPCLLDIYVEHFLAANSAAQTNWLIVPIPERLVRHIFDPPQGETRQHGVDALAAWIRHVLEAHQDRVIGWYLADEPELLHKRDYMDPDQMNELYQLVRAIEHDWRMVHDAFYIHLPVAERPQHLRPCMITFSPAFFTDPDVPYKSPWQYRNAADIFGYDQYPFRRKLADLVVSDRYTFDEIARHEAAERENLSSASGGRTEGDLIEESLRYFQEVRLQVNDFIEMRGNLGYKPVFNWLQGGGAPFRWPGDPGFSPEVTLVNDLWDGQPPEVPDPDWTTAPAGTPRRYRRYDVPAGQRIPNPLRMRRQPSLLELRMLTWASIFLESEGMPVFSQPGLASAVLQSDYAAVANEVRYFSNLLIHRDSFDISMEHMSVLWSPPQPVPGSPWAQPWVRLFEYAAPPSGEAWEFWLFLMNPTSRLRDVRLGFSPYVARQDHRFYRYVCGTPQPQENFLISVPRYHRLLPFSFALYRSALRVTLSEAGQIVLEVEPDFI